MQKWISRFFFAAFLAAPALPAQADTAGVTLKGGGFVQADANAQGKQFFAAGVVYDLVKPTRISPFHFSVYGDMLGKSAGAGFSLRSATPAYLGAGVGLYHTSITQQGGCPAIGLGGCPTTTLSSSGAGGKIFAGYNIGQYAAIEAGYHFLPQASGISTNAFTAQLGVRF